MTKRKGKTTAPGAKGPQHERGPATQIRGQQYRNDNEGQNRQPSCKGPASPT